MTSSQGQGHKRVYQACDNCREKKVRCDLGPVDTPNEPPCRRCRRENKHCSFISAKAKRKEPTAEILRADIQSGSVRPTKRTRVSEIRFTRIPESAAPSYTEVPDDTADPQVQVHPTPEKDQCMPLKEEDPNAVTLLKRPVATSYDVLSLMYWAGRRSRSEGESASGPSADSRATSLINSRNATADALNAWSQLHFVHTELLSAEEALSLVDYFFDNLAPFTPVISSMYQPHSMHQRLVEEEPILTMTILMLSSRFKSFTGPAAQTRSHIVHNKLWEHLQGMISHMIWGQEHFGGVFGRIPSLESFAMDQHYPDSAHRMCPPLGGLRTLGTCEALLLLTEWNPQAIHFPPRDDAYTIIPGTNRRNQIPKILPGMEFLYSAWRSDRMCWSMLGNALTLAVELGLYDELDKATSGTREARPQVWESASYRERADRLKQILPVYLAQISARLGRCNMLFPSLDDMDITSVQDDSIQCWTAISTLMRESSRRLFASRAHVSELIQTGRYVGALEKVRSSLKKWKKTFDMAKLSKAMRAILAIEYGYVRVTSNSIALHALTERYDRIAKGTDPSPQSAMLTAFRENESYILELIIAARSILQVMVDDLLPDEDVKHMPIRTYSRVLTAAVAIWKTFTLAVQQDEAALTLQVLERAAKALRTCVVDDVHLGNRFGSLLDTLVQNLQKRNYNLSMRVGDQGNVAYVSEVMGVESRSEQNVFSTPATVRTSIDRLSSITHHNLANSSHSIPPSTPRTETFGAQSDPHIPHSIPTTSSDVGSTSAQQFAQTSHEQLTATQVQLDPWLELAGSGITALDWSVDQDVFSLLGPLLDAENQNPNDMANIPHWGP